MICLGAADADLRQPADRAGSRNANAGRGAQLIDRERRGANGKIVFIEDGDIFGQAVIGDGPQPRYGHRIQPCFGQRLG